MLRTLLDLCRDEVFRRLPLRDLAFFDDLLGDIPADAPEPLGERYEQRRAAARGARKAGGIYYTPRPLVDHVVRHTLGAALAGKSAKEVARLRILDPACGSGAFLLAAYRFLLDWHRQHGKLTPVLRRRILIENIHGIDLDAEALAVTRLSLLGMAGNGNGGPLNLSANIQHGNALVGCDWDGTGCDWDARYPGVMRQGAFDVVLGNPPWGQKGIEATAALKRYLWSRYPSSAGIFDVFRPFVELGVRLTRPGGRFGMVLPDVVLLKDYPQTRLYLLDQLALERIDWWGRAFAGAVIDTATVIGRKEPAAAGHEVAVGVHDSDRPLEHALPQEEFRTNPRHVFNLHLTPARRTLLAQLNRCPRLGDFFEIHEGVHSGNIRAELFVRSSVDATCRELLLGRDEIEPYRLRWQGWYVRVAVMPRRKSKKRYANLGRPEWHQRAKVLVRRTGDFVLAAVDRRRRYASNNYFLIFPRQPCSLDLDGLCALLNSRWMTCYFRTIEPRRGRVFAELKIKHIRAFPLPPQALHPDGCAGLNALGRERRRGRGADGDINALVRQLFGVTEVD